MLEHVPLAKAIAVGVHQNLQVQVDLDNLVLAGVRGLFDAVTKYDSERNVPFLSYAKHRIRGAILDSLRQREWAFGGLVVLHAPGIESPAARLTR